MIKSFPTNCALFVWLLSMLTLSQLSAQQTVFTENFNAPGVTQSSSYTISGQINNSRWNVSRSGNDFGAKIDGGMLTLTNDAGGAGNVKGWVLASMSTSNFLPVYNPILSQNAGIVSWTFNMRQLRTNPAGLTDGLYGVGYILAGTEESTNKVGKGYAIMLGQSGNKDAIRFVTYNNGIQNYYTKFSSKTSGLSDFGREYTSIRVEYNPVNNEWSLYLRKDNTTSFNDPNSGTLVYQGMIANAEFVNEPLTMTGAYWNAATAQKQTAFFDNISVSVVTPEIISINPDSKIANSGAFTLTLDGKGFTSASRVYWNNIMLTPVTATATKLTVSIPNTYISTPAIIPITVRNGSFISNALAFEIEPSGVPSLTLSKNILPFISTVAPAASAATETYTITGSNLTSGQTTVTAPSNFEISRDSGATYFNSLTLASAGGPLTDGTVTLRARLKQNIPAGNYTGNIIHTANGAVSKNVAVSGRVLAKEPTENATLATFTNITSTGFKLDWTNSVNGGDQRIVLIKPLTEVNGLPVDATTYNANAAFATGSLIGTDNYVVYKGTGNSVQITGLEPDKLYHISIIEFNGGPGTENYRTAGLTGSAKTLNSPAGLQVKLFNTSYKIDFDNTVDGVNLDTFQGSGISKIAELGQLDSDSWAFTGFTSGPLVFGALTSLEDSSYENGTSDGDEVDTGMYAFNVGTAIDENYTLGIQPGGTDFNPGTITLRIHNQTGVPMTSVNIGYKVYVYNDQASSTKIAFNYSSDHSGTGTYSSPITTLDVDSPTTADLAPGWKAYYRVATINSLNIAKDKYFYIRWTGSSSPTTGLIDEFAIDDIEVIAGTTANPIANFVSFDGIAEDFVLQGNANLSGDLEVQNRLLFNGGKLAIKDKALTIAGSVTNTTLNGLTGGSTSKLVVKGIQNPTLSFDNAANTLQSLSLIGANPNTVKVLNNFSVNDLLTVDEQQVLNLGTFTLFGNLTSIQNNGIIQTQNTSLTPFTSGKTWNGIGILNLNAGAAQTLVEGTYNNLTLSSTGGTIAAANVTVNGILNLPAPNASATNGSLDMATYTLVMGPEGTNTGLGDVTGIIRRNTIVAGKLYTFGHPNSSILFQNAGTLPTALSAKLTIGEVPFWRLGAIKRQFDIIQTGAALTKALIRMHYLDTEINSNSESKLVFWANNVNTTPILAAGIFEQGRSNNNTTDNWVEITNADIGLYFQSTFDKVYITLDESEVADLRWNGSENTSWTTAANWTKSTGGTGVPSADSKVIIPNITGTSNRSPKIDENSVVKSITIEEGGIVDALENAKLTIHDGAGAWQNNGTLNPGTSEVVFISPDATIAGATTFNNITIATGASLRALEGSSMIVKGAFTNSGLMSFTLLPNTLEFTGTSQIVPLTGGSAQNGFYSLKFSGSGTTVATNDLNVRGDLMLNESVIFVGKTVNFRGVVDQTIGGTAAINFNNLIVNKETGAVILVQDISVGGKLTLTKGNLVLGDKNLTLGSSPVGGVFNTQNMIAADGGGFVRRPFTSVDKSYFFPIGELTGPPSYSPITVDITSATSFNDAVVAVNAKDEKHPNNFSVDNYIRHYWNVKQTGITDALASITANYEDLDIMGLEAKIAAAQLNGTFDQTSNPWMKFGPLSDNTLSATGATLTAGVNSVFTGIKGGSFTAEIYGYGDFCQNSPVELNAVTEGGDGPFTYVWTPTLPNAATVTVPTTSVGPITYKVTVRDANGFVAVGEGREVYIFPASEGGTIDVPSQDICLGSQPSDLKLTGSVGAIQYWQSSPDANFTDFTNIPNKTTILSGEQIGAVNETTYFRALLQSGDCAEKFSDYAVVRINTTTWNGITSGWSNGAPTATTAVVFAADYTATSDFKACSILVESGTITIPVGTSMTIQNNITNNGNIIVESDGNLIQINDSAVNSGVILVKRDLQFRNIERKEYNYLISPVEGGNLKTGIYRKEDKITPVNAPFTLYHTESNNKFYNSSGAYIAGRSLAVKEPALNSGALATAFFEGKPFNGIIAYNLFYSGPSLGYNLVGNPYPSNLDLNVLYADNQAEIESTFQFWDNTANAIYEQQGSGYTGNAYAVFNAVAGERGTGLPAPGKEQQEVLVPRTPNNIVKVGQGFMVKAKGTGKILNYRNYGRTAVNEGSVFYGKQSQEDRYFLKMTAPSGITSTIAMVYFAGGNNLFGTDDSAAIPSSDEVYSIVQGEKVAINGRSTFVNTDNIPLGTRHFVGGDYTIALGDQEGIFANGQSIYLKDKQTNTITNLKAGNYTFTANAGASTGRFEIIYQSDVVLVTESTFKEELTVYRDGEDFVVKAQTKKITRVEVYDMSGSLIFSQNANNTKVVVNGTSLSNGTYLLKINRGTEVYTKKILK